MSSVPLSWFELHWPREVDERRSTQALRQLVSSSATPVILEAVGVRGGVVHRIGLPTAAAPILLQQLRAALPALGLLRLRERPSIAVDRAVEITLNTTSRPLRVEETESASRALLTALSSCGAGESLVLQWQLVRPIAPRPVGNRETTPSSGSLAANVSRAVLGSAPLDAEARGSLRSKRSLPGWQVVGRIGVRGDHLPRQRQLIGQVIQALRSAEAPGVHFGLRSTAPKNLIAARRPWRVPVRLNIAELVAVAGWPIGDTSSLPVIRESSRTFAPSAAILSVGRRLGAATFPGRERPVALGVRDALRHLHVVGPSGVGKSTLLLNLICQDMAAGRAVVVVEPKGDLIADVLARVPADRLSDVVLIDPTDRDAVVGINPLAAAERSAELVADQLLSIFRHLYAASWGPRTSDILHASLITLARTPAMSLASLPLLLSDPSFRRRIVGDLNEPLVLQPFWQSFDAWTEAERAAATAPVLNKVRPLLVRPSLRAVLGQVSPRFQMRELFTERRILLVNLAKGLMGPEAAALLGSIVIAQFWQTAQERSGIPSALRHPIFVFVDEFQDYLQLPTDMGEALAQARGLGIGLTLAHQHLGQLSPSMRSALLANARSRVAFQLAAEDANVFAGSSTVLAPEDFRGLAAFEAYAQLLAHDSVQPWFSMRTMPAPPVSTDPTRVREASRNHYAVPPARIDQELQQLRGGKRERDLGPKRRTGADQ